MIYGRWWQLCPNYWGLLVAGNEFAANHVRPVKARWLENTPLCILPRHYSNPPLCFPVHSDCFHVSYNIIPQLVVALHRVQDICLHLDHEVLVLSINGPNCLGESKHTALPNVVRLQIEFHGADRLTLQRQRCQVQDFTDMPYRFGEKCDHNFPLSPFPLEVLVKMCPTPSYTIFREKMPGKRILRWHLFPNENHLRAISSAEKYIKLEIFSEVLIKSLFWLSFILLDY